MNHAVVNNPFLLKTLLGHTWITTPDCDIHASMPEVTVDLTPDLNGSKASVAA